MKNGYQNILLIDNSKEHVQFAQNLGINAKCIDFFDFYPDGLFDIIIANEITQFVPISDLIIFAKKYLVKKGIFMFVYLNPKSFRQSIKIFIFPQKKKQLHYITPQKINSQMKNDFELLQNLGYMWQVVGSHSNSYLVYIFSIIEKYLFLNKWIKRSPWIFACYRKK